MDRPYAPEGADLFASLRARVLAALHACVDELDPETAARVELTPARDPAHGDAATNAALLAAKPARRNPRDIAAELSRALADDPLIAAAEPAGPGFVNLRLRPAALHAVLPAILRAGEAYGASSIGGGQAINVEYVSANPTGPMHVGHCRGVVVGDALANLLAHAGYRVTKEYYINDAGGQVTALAWAAFWRYLQALGRDPGEDAIAEAAPGGLQYRGDYLIPVGAALAAAYGDRWADALRQPEQWLDIVRDFTVDAMMRGIRDDLALLGVRQDVFSSERALVEAGAADAMIQRMQAEGLVYRGILEPPKGKVPDDWEPREQLLFRSTAFGDDVDRPLRKSDGSNTYFANDIAYHADKLSRGTPTLIDVLGADHGGYVSRLQAATKALGGTLEVVLCQIVHVLKNGQPVRMSKRAGTYVTVRDLLDEVGRDALRFTMLTRKADAQMEFDIAKAIAQTRDNPVFYVQYAHARCRSVLRAAADMFPAADLAAESLAAAPTGILTDEAELALLRRLAVFPRVLEAAAQAREPHRIAFSLYDLAGDFNMLWSRGKDAAALKFLQPEQPEATRARLALVSATAVVIRAGLNVMGVEPVEEMR